MIDRQSKLCEWGFHSYRHVSLKSTYKPFIPGAIPSWSHLRRCKRCRIERDFTIFRYPRIRVYEWGTS